MKLLILVVCALIAAINAQAGTYTTKYDGVNLDEILKSERLLNNYFKCLMDTGKCTPDGNELKRTLPDALKTECSKCKSKTHYLPPTFSNLFYSLLKAAKSKRPELNASSATWSRKSPTNGLCCRRNTIPTTSTTQSSLTKLVPAALQFKNRSSLSNDDETTESCRLIYCDFKL